MAVLLGRGPADGADPVEPGDTLPGGLVALYDGRGRNETPVWIPEHRTLVFADALAAPRGELQVWDCPALRERALPALSALLGAAVRAGDRLPRGSGPRPRGLRAGAAAGALARLSRAAATACAVCQAVGMELTRFGVWTSLRAIGEENGPEAARLAESLGFGAFWLGGSPRLPAARALLEATDFAGRRHRHRQRLGL